MRWLSMTMLMWACTPSPEEEEQRPQPPPTEVPQWTMEATDRPNSQRLVVVLPEAAPLDVSCVADDDPVEIVGATSDVVDRWQDLVVHGLLTDTAYTCTWTAGDWTGDAAVHTDPAPDWVPSWTVEGTPGWGEWTLFNTGKTQGERNHQIVVVDGQGRLRWAHRLARDVPDIDASYIGSGEVLYGGGYEVKPAVIDLTGEVQRRAIASSTGEVYHHHAELVDGGQVLTMALAYHEHEGETYRGFTVEMLDPSLAARTWSFNSQRGLDDGWLSPPQFGGGDPFHPNSVQLVDDAVLVNIRHYHQVVKIDRQTSDRVWTLGKDGDFALVDLDGEALPDEEWAWGAHAPELDGDRILMHDNGWRRPGGKGNYSRVVEYRIDEQTMTATKLWDWTEPGWYEPIWGDVDRLDDGGVLITRAHCDCGDEDHRTQLIELGPGDPGEVVWRLIMGEHHDSGYRAQRLDACEMFDHRGLCPPE